MKASDKFMTKYMNDTWMLMKDVTAKTWILTTYYYMTDSKYRIRSRLKSWLNDQVTQANRNPDLLNLAKSLRKKTPEATVITVLKYVHGRVKYRSDNENVGYLEKWGNVGETLDSQMGDCEDMNTAIYVLCRLAGITSLKLFACIGDTSVGGHFWIMYQSDGRWYAIDSTYEVEFTYIRFRKPFELQDGRYKSIWYIFNENQTFKAI